MRNPFQRSHPVDDRDEPVEYAKYPLQDGD